MNWKAIKKSSGAVDPRVFTDADKKAWETHPITKGKYRFEEIPEKPKTQPPIEAKEVTPKKPK